MVWAHPFIPKYLVSSSGIVTALPDVMQKNPSPSDTNALYRSVESSETKTLMEWQDGYVLRPINGDELSATPKYGWGLTMTLMPVASMNVNTLGGM